MPAALQGGPGGRRRLQEARGTGTLPTLPAASQQAQQAQRRQLTSSELSDLLHAPFWAEQGQRVAAASQWAQQGGPSRQLRQAAGAAAPSPAAGSPPPVGTSVVDSGQMYVVASTGTSDGAPPNRKSLDAASAVGSFLCDPGAGLLGF